MPVGRVPDGRHIMPLSGVAVVDAPNCGPYRNWLLIVAKYRKPGSALSASAIEREYTNLSSIAPTPPPAPPHTHTFRILTANQPPRGCRLPARPLRRMLCPAAVTIDDASARSLGGTAATRDQPVLKVDCWSTSIAGRSCSPQHFHLVCLCAQMGCHRTHRTCERRRITLLHVRSAEQPPQGAKQERSTQ